jgi:hypothetical protein
MASRTPRLAIHGQFSAFSSQPISPRSHADVSRPPNAYGVGDQAQIGAFANSWATACAVDARLALANYDAFAVENAKESIASRCAVFDAKYSMRQRFKAAHLEALFASFVRWIDHTCCHAR